ncbi:pickpocket protein 28-like [Lycorma delicatula]|uniref:pickpocket protein 28-like n=1 Tax=Lycorma delicatula TaxID=130591 RepID=UPI003F51396F
MCTKRQVYNPESFRFKDLENQRNESINNIFKTKKKFWDANKGYESSSYNSYPWRVAADGVSGTTLLILKQNPRDYDEGCSRGNRGFRIIVHHPLEEPSSYIYRTILVQPSHITWIYVKPSMVNALDLKSWSPEKRNCYFPNERNLLYYTNYTQRNCDNECRSKTALKYCGCVTFFLPRNKSIPVCGPNKWICLWQSFRKSLALKKSKNKVHTLCNCIPSCNYIDYSTQHKTSPFNITSRSFYKNLTKNLSNDYEYSVISISFVSRQFQQANLIPFISFSDFIGNVGGIMSLFLGFSFLSLFELIYFLSIRIVFNIWNVKKSKQRKLKILSPLQRQKWDDFKNFFVFEDGLVYCNNVLSVMESFGHEYKTAEWHLFIDSSKASLEAMLLHTGNAFPSLPSLCLRSERNLNEYETSAR